MTEVNKEGVEHEPQLFTKKPVTIEAMQWDGTAEGATPIIDWVINNGGTARYVCDGEGDDDSKREHWLEIDTIEGRMRADVGWWVIRGVESEFYPCKPSVFADTYDHEPVRDRTRPGDFISVVSFDRDTFQRLTDLLAGSGRTLREMIETFVETVAQQSTVQIPDAPDKGRRFHMIRSKERGWRITLDGHDITKMVAGWFVEPWDDASTPARVNLQLTPDHVEIDQTIYAESR